MARPIKETPILNSEDARRFERQRDKVIKVSPERLEEMKVNFNKMQSIARFN